MKETTILIIEKDSYQRNILSRSLVRSGFIVFDASNDSQAIDIVLGLSEFNGIDYIVQFEEGTQSFILLKLCALKFKKSPVILSEGEDLEKLRNFLAVAV
jgi:CheY-like chemotaxis protein